MFLSVTLAASLISGCSLEVPQPGNRTLSIRLTETPSALDQVSNNLGLFAAPASTAPINCFFLNVTGGGIFSEKKFPPNCTINDNMHARGIGAGSQPTPRGAPMEVSLPSGTTRQIDVYGLIPDDGIPGCPGAAIEPTGNRSAYFLGGVSLDLTDNRIIDVPITISASTPESMSCTPGGGGSGSNSSPFVLGQPDLTTGTANTGGLSAQTLSGPGNAFIGAGKLFVSDLNNNRVLIWNSIPGSTQISADVVLGQTNFTSGTANFGGVSASSLNCPTAVFTDGTKLIVADGGNNRVLIWNTIPTVNNTVADVVVGQTIFTATGSGTAAGTMNNPTSVWKAGTKLIVADRLNNRVLIFNTIPGSNGASANVAVGQPNLAVGTANNGGISGATLNVPNIATSDGTKLFIADKSNHRVLIYNTIPGVNGATANIVLGQPNFTSNASGTTATTLNSPTAVLAGSNKLLVSDQLNHRVLIWDTVPTVDQTAANFAIGQPDLTSGTANNGGLSGQSLNGPAGLTTSASHLFISDSGNSRILARPFSGL